jgi:hypothetical protein
VTCNQAHAPSPTPLPPPVTRVGTIDLQHDARYGLLAHESRRRRMHDFFAIPMRIWLCCVILVPLAAQYMLTTSVELPSLSTR